MPYLSDKRKRREKSSSFPFHIIIIIIFILLAVSLLQLSYVEKIFAFKALGQESIVGYNPHTKKRREYKHMHVCVCIMCQLLEALRTLITKYP